MNRANLLSLVRIGLTPLAARLVYEGSSLSFAVIATALITDFLDGWTARRRGESTMLGRILDPIADKLLAASILVALAASARVPWELVTLVLCRDVILLSGAWLKIRAGEPVPTANVAGKIAFALLGLYVLALTAGMALPTWVGGAVAGAYAASALSYVGRVPAGLLGRVAKEQR